MPDLLLPPIPIDIQQVLGLSPGARPEKRAPGRQTPPAYSSLSGALNSLLGGEDPPEEQQSWWGRLASKRPMSVPGLLKAVEGELFPKGRTPLNLVELGRQEYSGRPVAALLDAATYGPGAVSPAFKKQADAAASVLGMASMAGSFVMPGGEVIPVDDMARHWNLLRPKDVLKKGGVRVRGDGLEIHDLLTADPDALRTATMDVAGRNKLVYVDMAHESAVYDAGQLAEAGFDLKKVRPLQFWLKEL